MNREVERPVLLMIAERFPPDLGGVARSSARTAHAISRLGWDVHVLGWTKSLPPGEVDTIDSYGSVDEASIVTVHRLGLFSNWDYSMQHTSNVLEWLHEKFGYSAIWGHYLYPAGYLAVVFAETIGIPSTVSARGNDIDRLMFPPGDFGRLLWTLQRASVVSCVSEDLAGKVRMLLGRPIDIAVLPNVVNTQVFCPTNGSDSDREEKLLREQLGFNDEDAVLGFCGELRHKKGLPFILSALAEVVGKRPARLLVIGEVRPRERAHLAAFATEYPEAAERIRITGPLDDPHDVAKHFRICDVVLQPSVWDGMPNSVLEAMSCGNLVLASDAGGIPEAIEHGVSGFVIAKAQLHQLGTAVLELLELDSKQKHAISQAARQRIEQQFNHQTEAERLVELLQRLSSGVSINRW